MNTSIFFTIAAFLEKIWYVQNNPSPPFGWGYFRHRNWTLKPPWICYLHPYNNYSTKDLKKFTIFNAILETSEKKWVHFRH